MDLKSFIPMSFMVFLKTLCRKKRSLFLDAMPKGKKIVYLDAPDYGNLGDQMIAYGVGEYAKRYFEDYAFAEYSYNEYLSNRSYFKKNITSEDIIFLTGGGNMGNIYRTYEAVRRDIINRFKKNKIIVFPQTIDYTKDAIGRLSCKKAVSVYSKHKSLTLCAREEKTYKTMSLLFTRNKIILCPDIVLSLKIDYENNVRRGCGVCLRQDCESILDSAEQGYINEAIDRSYDEKITLTTSALPRQKVNKNTRKAILQDKLSEFSSCELVITDRLHAMIFSVLTHTPCVVFDNSNAKISGVYKWIKSLPYIKLISDVREIENSIKELKTVKITEDMACNFNFEIIKETLL